ncbi:MAG: hypothetical protein EU531_11790, partial [Promethearchaeota archaeon]
MSEFQLKEKLGTGILVILFAIICGTMVFEPALLTPTIEVVYGEDVDAPEDLEIAYSSYTPQSVERIVNYSSVNTDHWFIDSDGASTRFYVSLRNISKIIIGMSVASFGKSVNLSLYEYGYSILNSTAIGKFQTREHFLEIPCNQSSYLRLIDVRIRLTNCSWEDIEITGFWVDIVTIDVLYPVVIDIQRTNGESLFSNPTMKMIGRQIDPMVQIDSIPLGISYVMYLGRPDRLILLPPGDYNISMSWNMDLKGTISLSNTSAGLTWRIKCVRVDIDLGQEIPELYLWVDYYHYEVSLLYSPSLYLPSGRSVDMRIGSNSDSFSGHVSSLIDLAVGQNQNITFVISPGIISIGAISITPGRLLIFSCSLIMMCGIILIANRKLVSNIRILSFLILFMGVLFPWIQYSQIDTKPATPTFSEFRIVWDISPGISTSFASQDNSSLLIAPSNESAFTYPRFQLGFFVFLLFAIFFVIVLAELYEIPRIPKVGNVYISFLVVCILVLNLIFIWNGFQYFSMGWVDSIQLGFGSILTILSVSVWAYPAYRR